MIGNIKLNNGALIPEVGFGTWQTPDGETAVNSVMCAVKAGYTHIDTAAVYGNEVSVGKAIKESGVSRDKLFVTSKVWNTERGYESTLKAFEKTLKDLQLDYLDLYLIHWPASSHRFENWEEINAETWRAMEELYHAGKIKAIGVSNFKVHHLEALLKTAKVLPAINQIEFHPGYMQEDVVDFCKEKGIVVEAWSPLGCGRVLDDERLKEIAAKYNKSVAQLCIQWCLQNGTLPLPKSVTPSRIVDNLKVRDFMISSEDMEKINSFAQFGFSGLNPDKIDF